MQHRTPFLVLVMLILVFPATVCMTPTDQKRDGPSIEQQGSAVSEVIQRPIRVAVYDERNHTTPGYSHIGLWAQNGTVMASFLASRGFDVTLVDASDITDGILSTARFDVLVLPDSVPRENGTNFVKQFWLAGGGILSIDSSISYVCFAGMLPHESEGNNGYGTYWSYVWSELQVVKSLHATTRKYHVGDMVNSTLFDWATFSRTALDSTADSSLYTVLLTTQSSDDSVTGIAYDSSVRGGKVVQLPGPGDEIVPGLADLIADSVTWLAPNPRARIVFDLSHRPRLAVDTWDTQSMFPGRYRALRDALVSRRFTFDKLYPTPTANLTLERLMPYDILILVCPDFNYTQSEVDAVKAWVAMGRSLWVFGEHPSIGFAKHDSQLNRIISDMGIQIWLDGGDSVDRTYTKRMHVVNDISTDLYCVTKGYLNISNSAVPLWTYEGNTVAAVSTYQNGRVFVMADMNWAESTQFSSNRFFAVTVPTWLGAVGSSILYFTNEPASVNYYRTPAALALNELGLKYMVVTTSSCLNYTLVADHYDLTVIDSPLSAITSSLNSIESYVRNGGKLIMSYYYAQATPTHGLWPLLGFKPLGPLPNPDPVYIWDTNHPAFLHPVHYGATRFNTTIDYGTMGSVMYVFDNATPIAGSTPTPSENKSLIIERKDGQTIYVGWLIDGFAADSDKSAYPDNFELWLGLISYMMRPTLSSPSDIELDEGTTSGHKITWQANSYSPRRYVVRVNGTPVVDSIWSVSGPIQYDLGNLARGTYVVELTVYDIADHSSSDEVLVRVRPVITPPFGLDMWLLLLIGGVGAVVVIGAVALARRPKPPKMPPSRTRKTKK